MAKRNSTRRSAARRPRAPARGAPPAPAKQSLRERIEQQIGETPINDSLAAVTWMQRVLAVAAAHVVDSEFDDSKKRAEMLKIADRMAKLRDIDRIHPGRADAARCARPARGGTARAADERCREPRRSSW